jgi:release factor glutamine methyltransferase
LTGTSPEFVEFGELDIAFDSRVLRPRAWTLAQSRWAAELLAELPPGPVLELCSGAGHIGLAAVSGTDRTLICVDVDPVAADFARANARRAGLEDQVQLRVGTLREALDEDERFCLVIADPPWVVHTEIGRFPEDPPRAIDGGDDGLSVARECLRVIERHMTDAGQALLQLGDLGQVSTLFRTTGVLLDLAETRTYEGGVVARVTPSPERDQHRQTAAPAAHA